MYRLFSLLYPKGLKKNFGEMLVYANIKFEQNTFLGFIFVYNILMSAVLGFFLGAFYGKPFCIISLLTFFIIYIALYFWLLINADKKAKFIEEVLLDALQLMASNLRAGFTTDRALLLAARPEFGPFQEEINLVGKQITTGKPITSSLKEMSKRIRSDKLERTVNLIISGLQSGGRLADLLQETSNDLKNQALVDKKIRTSVNMYVIFIIIATAAGAPMLFGLSSFLVEVMTATIKSVEIPSQITASIDIPLSLKAIAISPEFVKNYAIISIITTAIFGSFIVGLISKGKEKEGIRMLPVLIIISLLLFFLVRLVARSLLGNLFGV